MLSLLACVLDPRRMVEREKDTVDHGRAARRFRQLAQGEALKTIDIPAQHGDLDRHLPKVLGIDILRCAARRQELFEKPLAVGKGPAKSRKLGGAHAQQCDSEFHDVVKTQGDAHRLVSPESQKFR